MSGGSKSKKNIILLHGWGASCKKLKPLARNLRTNGWRVINFRLPGFDLAQPKISWSVIDYAKLDRSTLFLGTLEENYKKGLKDYQRLGNVMFNWV